MNDDDEWVDGIPPEGVNRSDPARTEFWRSQWRRPALGAGLLLAILLVTVVVLAAS